MSNKQDAAFAAAMVGKDFELTEYHAKEARDIFDAGVAFTLKQSLAQPPADALTDEKISEIYQATWNEDGRAVRRAPATPELVFRFARNIAKGFLAQSQDVVQNAYDRGYGAGQEIGWREGKADAIRNDAVQPQAPVVPEGWRLVPIEADHKMRDAGFAAFRAKGLFDDIFRAMALAAPATPPAPADGDRRDVWYGLLIKGTRRFAETFDTKEEAERVAKMLGEDHYQIVAIAQQSSGKEGV